MQDAAPILAMSIMGFVIALSGMLIVKLTVWMRDALRQRYTGGQWNPRIPDLVGVPSWLGIEALCFTCALVSFVLAVASMIFLATRFRNWWHDQ